VIVGGDSDFLSLVEKLKQYDKKVFVVGGRAFTSVILQRNCHEFIAYENLQGVRKTAIRSGRPMPAAAANAPIAQALPIVRRALKILADREVSPQTGLLKSTLLQLDSTFSERNYGASSFLDFVEKLAQSGFVQLKTSGRSVMVELNPSVTDDGDAGSPKTRAATEGETVETAVAQAVRPAGETPGYARPSPETPAHPAVTDAPEGPPAGDQADGVRHVGAILAAATTARWPMYLRNVKQILRAADRGFDERRYGFGGLMDLLRACQREDYIRLERDRRGGLRVFQGAALLRASTPAPQTTDAFESQPIEGALVESAGPSESSESDPLDIEPMPIVDPTAELLGRAKARRPRTRLSAAPVPSPSRARARKPAARPSTAAAKATKVRATARSKKTAATDAKDHSDR
jgi:hypothetical protein